MTTERSGKLRSGFGSMDPAKQREIARKGGAAVPAEKRSFSQDRSLAADAGRKGGQARHRTRGPQKQKPTSVQAPMDFNPARSVAADYRD